MGSLAATITLAGAWLGCQSIAGFESDYHLADDGDAGLDAAHPSDATAGDHAQGEASTDLDAPSSPDVPLFSTDASPDALNQCVVASESLVHVPVYLVIALDGSGSMTQDNKWSAVVPALANFFATLGSAADPSVGVGFMIFSDQNDPCMNGFGGQTCGSYSLASPNVPIALVDSVQAQKMISRVQSTAPAGATPTIEVLQGMYATLEGFQPAGSLLPNGKKVLVLITDGVPTDTLPPDAGTTAQQVCIGMASSESAKAPPGGPVATFVVGVGNLPATDPNTFDPAFLGKLAQAGGTARPGCDPTTTTDATKMCHFQITPSAAGSAQQLEQQFVAALDSIRTEATPCEFTIDVTGGITIAATQSNVEVDTGGDAGPSSSILHYDATDGWTFDSDASPKKVLLHGASCAAARATPTAKYKLLIGCARQ